MFVMFNMTTGLAEIGAYRWQPSFPKRRTYPVAPLSNLRSFWAEVLLFLRSHCDGLPAKVRSGAVRVRMDSVPGIPALIRHIEGNPRAARSRTALEPPTPKYATDSTVSPLFRD